jgi:hypothetical protein
MELDALRLVVKLFLIVTVVTTVFFYLLAIFLEPVLFYFTSQGTVISVRPLSSFPVWFFTIVGFNIHVDLNYSIVFLFLWSVFTVSFVAAWKQRVNFHKIIRESIVKPVRNLFRSCLFSLPIITSMTLIGVVVIQSFQEVGGIPTGTPPLQGEPFLDFFDLSYAAVAEEVGFRIVPIGAFLILYFFLAKKNVVKTLSFRQRLKLIFVAPFFPDKAKGMAGAKTVDEYGIRGGISLGEWGMVLFTSIAFGLAHFVPGGSWEVGKVSSAAVTGLVLGLSYLAYGFQASIIIHWFFNAYTDTFFLLSEIYPNVTPFADAVTMFTFVLGILAWAAIAIVGYSRLIRAVIRRKEE